jgi:indole-3-glycerol phosphate synthase
MILDDIVRKKQQEIALMPDIDEALLVHNNRDFLAAVVAAKGHAVIAELKARSPSEGVICSDYNPVAIAKQYQEGGVACISVLTDESFFGGSFEHLKQVQRAVTIPVLCKEFILDVKQIKQARQAGASACLLIVRILSDAQLHELYHEITRWNMTPLVEVFDQADCARAIKLGAKLVGINNRNLDTLVMDTANSQRLNTVFPRGTTVLSLSGAKTPEDIKHMCQQFDGALVGTALMRATDRVGFLQSCYS